LIHEIFHYLFTSTKFSIENTYENEIERNNMLNIILGKLIQNENKSNIIKQDEKIIVSQDFNGNISTQDTKNGNLY
jgi:hypothetical protein